MDMFVEIENVSTKTNNKEDKQHMKEQETKKSSLPGPGEGTTFLAAQRERERCPVVANNRSCL